jgi:hypothetical protein
VTRYGVSIDNWFYGTLIICNGLPTMGISLLPFSCPRIQHRNLRQCVEYFLREIITWVICGKKREHFYTYLFIKKFTVVGQDLSVLKARDVLKLLDRAYNNTVRNSYTSVGK